MNWSKHYQMKSLQWAQKVGCRKKYSWNLWSLTVNTFFCFIAPRLPNPRSNPFGCSSAILEHLHWLALFGSGEVLFGWVRMTSFDDPDVFGLSERQQKKLACLIVVAPVAISNRNFLRAIQIREKVTEKIARQMSDLSEWNRKSLRTSSRDVTYLRPYLVAVVYQRDDF